MLKENWTYKKLGEACEIYQPQTISTEMLVPDGEYLVYGANGIIGRYDKYNHIESEVLLTCRGATCGSINVSAPYSWINGNAMVIHPIDDSVFCSRSFLVYLMKSIDYSLVITGAAQPQITRQKLSPVKIAIPPIETQSRIVSELDLLQSIIDKQKAQLKELDNLAQAVFYDMFGDPVENDKGWEVKKLGEVCTFLQGEQVPIEEQFFEKKDGTIRFLRIVDFTQGNEEPRYVYCKDEKHILHDKEIAIVRYGTPGFVCYGKFGLIANNLFKVVPKNINSFDFRYLVSWLESSAFQSTVQDNQYGAALQAIKFGTIQNINIIMPPLSLQQSFAAKIESVEKQKAAITQSIAETQRLFDYTMDKYFG